MCHRRGMGVVVLCASDRTSMNGLEVGPRGNYDWSVDSQAVICL